MTSMDILNRIYDSKQFKALDLLACLRHFSDHKPILLTRQLLDEDEHETNTIKRPLTELVMQKDAWWLLSRAPGTPLTVEQLRELVGGHSRVPIFARFHDLRPAYRVRMVREVYSYDGPVEFNLKPIEVGDGKD